MQGLSFSAIKKPILMRCLVLLSFLSAHFLSYAQVTYNISGHAYLEGEEDHSPLLFTVINPQSLDTLAVTSPNSSGFYSIDVSPGFYLLNWSHVGHIPQELGDFAFSTDTVLADVTLLSGYVQDACGEVSGVWPSGSVYDVLCDIEIPEGDTLTIESGTRVRFTAGTNLICNGVLRVLGDPSDRVTFTSREPSPLPGDWGHVSLYAEGNTISHLDYEYANDGFVGDGASYTTVDNMVMSGNLSLSANGIYLNNSPNLTVTNNTISVGGDFGIHSPDSPNSLVDNNDISGSSSGLYFGNSSGLTVTNNTFLLDGSYGVYSPNSPNSLVDNNDVSGPSNGLYFENSSGLSVTNNTLSVNGDHGIYSPHSPSSLIDNNDISGFREYGLNVHSSDSVVVNNNVMTSHIDGGERNNTAIGNPSSSGSVFTNNTIDLSQPDGNLYGINTQDAIIENNTISLFSWTCQYWCSDNSYAVSADGSVIKENVINADLTSCCGGDKYAIISHGNENTTSAIANNTIHSGDANNTRGILASYADLHDNVVEARGRAVVIVGNSSVAFNTITSSHSTAINSGGVGSLTVTDNTITSNSTAIDVSDIGSLTVTDNTITSNSTAISLNGSDVVVSHNLIESQGRGVQMSNQSGGEVANNTIVSSNSADYGIHISDLTAPVVQNNIVEGFANGIYAENDLQNQFIRNNNLWNISGDLFSGTAMPALVGEMIDLNLNGDECDIYSNLNLDPLFVNPDSADYTLQLASPCINAGSEGSELDPDGTIADIGAFYNPIPYGCTDPAAVNYDEDAYLDNGTCLYGGCMYTDACNFDPEATIDDESCDFSCLTTGCSNEAAINYDVFADGSDDGGCLFIGCQDETALNYDASANYPGLCDYLELCPGDFSGDGLVDIVDLLDLFTMWDDVCPLIVD